jgi:cytoskeletal protein CcmA (bactofilin family)
MKFKREPDQEVLSVLAEGVEFTGELRFASALRVDGVVRGKLISEGSLMIGPSGRVEAEVATRRVSISGEFHGTIRASDRIEVHKDGKVHGDLYTPCLIIEAGALFEGKCNMSEGAGANIREESLLKVVEGGAEAGRTA